MSEDPDKPKNENIFKPSSKIMALRKKQPLGLPNPAPSGSQNQSQNIGQPAPRAQSQDERPRIRPNPNSARQRDLSQNPSQEAEIEEEVTTTRRRPQGTNNLLNAPKENRTNRNLGGSRNARPNTSNSRVVFGGQGGANISSLANYDKESKMKTDFLNNIKAEEIYRGRKFLFPIDVKIKTEEKEEQPKTGMIVESEIPKVKPPQEKKIVDTLLDEFCFFQLPANLPLERCAELTPITENSDIEINTEDLLSSFLNNRFDSTGFYLERDFKLLAGGSNEKMVEEKEKNEKRGKESKDKEKASSEKMYETFHIGKLCRMKNGEIKMRIGNNFFDVTEGVQDSFYKELFAIDQEDKVAYSLFPIEKKFVIKPDMESFY